MHAPMQDGRCKTLDAGADGYMRGEACVVHLIEAFEAAELAACHLADGALILHGTAVNQDGRSSSLTVPHHLIFPVFCPDSALDRERQHLLCLYLHSNYLTALAGWMAADGS